jgi:methyl-accepting chemotaxis protein
MSLERAKTFLIFAREPAKTLLWFAVAVCAAILTYEIVLTMRAVRHQAEASANYNERLQRILEQGEGGVADIHELTSQIKREVPALISEMSGAVTDTRQVIRSLNGPVIGLNGIVADIRRGTLPLVNTNLVTLNDNQIKLGETIEVTRDGLKQTLATLALAGQDVRLITSDPALQSLPEEINALTKSLNRTAGKVEVIADDLHATGQNITGVTSNLNQMSADVQKWSNAMLFPPKEKGFTGFMKRYVLAPLKTAGGVVYIWVKILNGL